MAGTIIFLGMMCIAAFAGTLYFYTRKQFVFALATFVLGISFALGGLTSGMEESEILLMPATVEILKPFVIIGGWIMWLVICTFIVVLFLAALSTGFTFFKKKREADVKIGKVF